MAYLIGGGSGFIGKAFLQSLKSKGIKAYNVTRRVKNANIDLSWQDIKTGGVPLDVEHILNLSGRNLGEINPLYCFNKSSYENYKEDLLNSRLETTKIMTKAIEQQKDNNKIKTFVNGSGINYYNSKSDPMNKYTEADIAVSPRTFIEDMAQKWESAAVLSAEAAAKTKVVTLRTGFVLGMGSPTFKRMYYQFRLNLGTYTTSGDQMVSWIHIEDMVNLIHHAFSDSCQAGPLNCTSPTPVTNKTFCKSLAFTLERSCMFSMPEFMLRAIFQDRADVFMKSLNVYPEKALSQGYTFQHGKIDMAFRDLLRT